jgi:hypothetical protein
MEIRPFEELRVTTMTLVMSLEGTVDLRPCFLLLPITLVDLPPQKRKTKKCRLPHHPVPGSILSARYYGNIRGVVRSLNKTFFKNSITIDISTAHKNVSVKLSTSTIQLCGASSRSNGVEAAQHIINHLSHINAMLCYIQQHPSEMETALAWMEKVCKGDPFTVEGVRETRSLYGGEKRLHILVSKEENLLICPLRPPPGVSLSLFRFLRQQVTDFLYYSDYIQKLRFLRVITCVSTPTVSISALSEAMVNYNYSLGFDIDREALREALDGYDGFYARYDNLVQHNVTIELPYPPSSCTGVFAKKKGKVPHSTFLVYKSGLVTQSGPGGVIMEEAYYKFRRTIHQFMLRTTTKCD